MEEKCFCHLNGYKVKDAEARGNIEDIKTKIGNLEELSSEDKSSLVSAINEVITSSASKITLEDLKAITGELESLNTTDKTTLVNAINEVITSSASGGNSIETLTDETIDLAELNVGIYILSSTVKNIKCGSYSASKYSLISSQGKYKILIVGTAGNTYNIGYLFDYTKIVFLMNYSGANGYYYEAPMTSLSQILPKNNTTSYTPTSDYHPATKKYVDDTVANISTGGGADLTNYYTKDETNNLLGSKVDDSIYESKIDEIETDIFNKVDKTTYNSKISEIESNITTLTGKSHNVYSGTSDPTSDIGSDGDVYFQYSE